MRATAGEDDADEAGDAGGCSGRSCRSCSGVAIADCVALCCCPCGVVSLAVLVLVKVPWAVGRRWVRRRRRRRRVVVGNEASAAAGKEAEAGAGDGEVRWSAGREAERVWLELYQAGELGFGRRVSVTGVS